MSVAVNQTLSETTPEFLPENDTNREENTAGLSTAATPIKTGDGASCDLAAKGNGADVSGASGDRSEGAQSLSYQAAEALDTMDHSDDASSQQLQGSPKDKPPEQESVATSHSDKGSESRSDKDTQPPPLATDKDAHSADSDAIEQLTELPRLEMTLAEPAQPAGETPNLLSPKANQSMSAEQALASIEALTRNLISTSKSQARATKDNHIEGQGKTASENKIAVEGSEKNETQSDVSVKSIEILDGNVHQTQGQGETVSKNKTTFELSGNNEKQVELSVKNVGISDESVDKNQEELLMNDTANVDVNVSADKSQESLDEVAAMALFNVVNEPEALARRTDLDRSRPSHITPITESPPSRVLAQENIDLDSDIVNISSDIEGIEMPSSERVSQVETINTDSAEKQNSNGDKVICLDDSVPDVTLTASNEKEAPQSDDSLTRSTNVPPDIEEVSNRKQTLGIDISMIENNEEDPQKYIESSTNKPNSDDVQVLGGAQQEKGNKETVNEVSMSAEKSSITSDQNKDCNEGVKTTLNTESRKTPDVQEIAESNKDPRTTASVELMVTNGEEKNEQRSSQNTPEPTIARVEMSESCEDMGFMISNVMSLSESPDKEVLFQSEAANESPDTNAVLQSDTVGKSPDRDVLLQTEAVSEAAEKDSSSSEIASITSSLLLEQLTKKSNNKDSARDGKKNQPKAAVETVSANKGDGSSLTKKNDCKQSAKSQDNSPEVCNTTVNSREISNPTESALDLTNSSPSKSSTNQPQVENEPLNLSVESIPALNESRTTPVESHFDMDGPLVSPFSQTNSRASSPGTTASSIRTLSPAPVQQPPKETRVNKRKRKDPVRSQKYTDRSKCASSSETIGSSKPTSSGGSTSKTRRDVTEMLDKVVPICLDNYIESHPRPVIKQEKEDDFHLHHQQALTHMPPQTSTPLQNMRNMAGSQPRFSPPDRFTIPHHPGGRFPTPQQTTLHVIEPENPWAPGLPPPPPGLHLPSRFPEPPNPFMGNHLPRVSMPSGPHLVFPDQLLNNPRMMPPAGNHSLLRMGNQSMISHMRPGMNPAAPHMIANRPMHPQTIGLTPDFLNQAAVPFRYNMNQTVSLLPHPHPMPPGNVTVNNFRPILGSASDFLRPTAIRPRPATQPELMARPPQPIAIIPSLASSAPARPVTIVTPPRLQTSNAFLIETSVPPTAFVRKSAAAPRNTNAQSILSPPGNRPNVSISTKPATTGVIGTIQAVVTTSRPLSSTILVQSLPSNLATTSAAKNSAASKSSNKGKVKSTKPVKRPDPSRTMANLEEENSILNKNQVLATPRENKSIISSDILKKKYNSYKATQPPAKLKMAPVKTNKCLGCGDEFLFKSSLTNHIERKSMEIEYNCLECKKVVVFWNRCTLFAHAKGHAKGAKAYRLNINNAVISVLPDELMPSAGLPPKETADVSSTTSPDNTNTQPSIADKRPPNIDLSKSKDQNDAAKSKESLKSKGKTNGSVESPIEIPDSPTLETAPSIPDKAAITGPVNKSLERIRIFTLEHLGLDEKVTHYSSRFVDGKLMYQCTECNSRDFTSLEKLKQHFHSYLGKPSFEKCPTCKVEIKGRCALLAHKRIHTRKRPYVCPECAETIEGPWDVFKKHLNNRCLHNQRSLLMRCTLCNIVILFDSNTVTSHYIEHHSTKYYKCTQCPMAFKTEENFANHRLTTHNSPVNVPCSVICKCALCDTVFQNMPTVMTHFETTHFPKLGETACFVAYKCTLCQPQKLFNSKESCAKHVQVMHKVKVMNYMCNLCGVGLPSPKKLLEHRLSKHSDAKCTLNTGWQKLDYAMRLMKKPVTIIPTSPLSPPPPVKIFKCEKCNSILKDKELYEKHMRKHRFVEKRKEAGEKVQSIKIKINCKDGDEFKVVGVPGNLDKDSSSTDNKLKRKLNDDTKDTDKNSNEINESDTESATSSSPDKKKQKLLDSIEKNHPVVKVRKEFMGQVPTAPIPKNRFACTECNERLPTQQALREHLKSVHAVAPQFPCHLCGNTYMSAGGVFRHIQTVHEGKSKDKKYWCWVCMDQSVKKGYPTWKMLEKHLTNQHKVHKNNIDYSKFCGGIQNGINGMDTDDDAKSDVSGTKGDQKEEDEDVPVKRLKTSADSVFTCAKCTFTAEDRKKFAPHILKHKIDASELQCQECGLCFSVLPALKRHLFMVHKQRDMSVYRQQTGVDVQREEQRALAASRGVNNFGSGGGGGNLHGGSSPCKSQIPNGIRDPTSSQKKVHKKPRPKPEKQGTESSDPLVTLECNVCYRTFEDAAKLRTHMRSHGMAFIRSRRTPLPTAQPVVEPAK